MTSPLPELPTENDFDYNPESEVDFDVLNKNYQKKNIYNENNNKGKNFSPKFILSFLFLIAIGTLAYGFYSLSSRIYQSDNFAGAEATVVPQTDNFVDQMAEQKNLDTDKDGLSDYEETNTYETSPYLADTDSDGYDDKTEIERGHDPLCPTLDNCRGDWTGKTPTEADIPTNIETENLINNTLATENTENAANEEANSSSKLTAEQLQALNSLTAAEVRELLISEGQVSEEELSAIDDETLMQIYKEALASEQQ